MILTYNLKHGRDFSGELKKTKQIAEFAIRIKYKNIRSRLGAIWCSSATRESIMQRA
jgi:hypothetical protein